MTVSDGIWQLEGNAQEYRISELQKEIIAFLKDAGAHGLSAGDIIDLTEKPENKGINKEGFLGMERIRDYQRKRIVYKSFLFNFLIELRHLFINAGCHLFILTAKQ